MKSENCKKIILIRISYGVVILLMMAIAIPSLMPARSETCKKLIMNNLRIVEDAVDEANAEYDISNSVAILDFTNNLISRNKSVDVDYAVTNSVTNRFDFGTMPRNGVFYHDYWIENSGSVPWEIRKLRPSCVCLQVLDYPVVIGPGERGKIGMRLIPDKAGPVSYRCFVELSDQDNPLRLLVFEGNVMAPNSETVDMSLKSIAPLLFKRRLHKPDEELYLSVQNVMDTGQPSETYRIFDLRPKEAFERIRIPGSTHETMSHIRVRRYLAEENIVLVGSGPDRLNLETQCRELRIAGFASVHILQGGLAAWARAGGKFAGSVRDQQELVRIAPQVFHELVSTRDVQVVLMKPLTSRERYLLPYARELEPFGLQSRSGACVDLLKAKGSSPVVFVGGTDDNMKFFGEILTHTTVPAFFLDGGVPAYERLLHEMTAIHEKRKGQTRKSELRKGLKSRLLKGCGGCS